MQYIKFLYKAFLIYEDTNNNNKKIIILFFGSPIYVSSLDH